MARIVYLMGAGASINCIPVVEGLRVGYSKIRTKINDGELSDSYVNGFNKEDWVSIKREFIKELDFLLSISNNRASIDTVAKSYFLQGRTSELRRLKVNLDSYLLMEQYFTPVDRRYDLFIASIFDKSLLDFPKEIKILSWNYDNQFELAFNDFSSEPKALGNREELRIHDVHSFDTNMKENAFIFKLNGSAGYYYNKIWNSGSYKTNLDLKSIAQSYVELNSNIHLAPGISFAWENPLKIQECIVPVLKDCEIIVTIGYSFPFFNREIDKMIFKEAKKLNKIYIQNPHALEIEEKLQNLIDPNRKIQFVQDSSTHEFMIPYEL